LVAVREGRWGVQDLAGLFAL